MAIEEPPSSPLSEPRSDLSNPFTSQKPRVKAPLSEDNQLDDSNVNDIFRKTDNPSTSRPSRKRAAPVKFDQEVQLSRPPKRRTPNPQDTEEDELSAPPKASANMGAKLKKQPVRGNMSVKHLMTSPQSKLGAITSAQLQRLLNNERAWTELSREEQEKLVSMLPGASMPELPEDIPLPNVPKEFLRTSQTFRSHVGLFQEDLIQGRYEPKWLEDAQKAMRDRANGVFDSWKEKNMEQFWGQKQKIDWKASAGESSAHDLPTLVKAGMFQVGDIFKLHRGYGRGKHAVAVEKEATVTAVGADGMLSFRFAPGQHPLQTHHPISDNDIRLDDVDGPTTLSNAILNEGGRIVGVRANNAWKEFRCSRNNQDVGSLWDLREQYHTRLGR